MATFRGKPACACLAAWLPAYEAELLRRGVIVRSIDVYQLIGGATASAGTHSQGGAFDLGQTSDEAIWVARQMGAATWKRTPAQGFILHSHGVLRGCPHNTPARYQIDALDAGFNGLGRGGRGGRDDGPRPVPQRTWQQGIAWAVAQIPKELPQRVQKTREQLAVDIAETTREIKRTKKARKVARKKGENLSVYREAIAAMKRVRAEQRRARRALKRAPKR